MSMAISKRVSTLRKASAAAVAKKPEPKKAKAAKKKAKPMRAMTLEDDEGVDWVGGASQRERVATGAEDDQHAAAWHRQYGARKWGDVNPLRAAKEQADAKAREEAEARRVNRGAKWEKAQPFTDRSSCAIEYAYLQ